MHGRGTDLYQWGGGGGAPLACLRGLCQGAAASLLQAQRCCSATPPPLQLRHPQRQLPQNPPAPDHRHLVLLVLLLLAVAEQPLDLLLCLAPALPPTQAAAAAA